MSGDEIVAPISKTEYVVQRLRQEIMAGTILPGGVLRQSDIAERYGVSPTPVREALRLLEAAGTVTFTPNRGATVRDLTDDQLSDVYRMRASLEGLATQISVERPSANMVDDLRKAQAELNEVLEGGDARQLPELNRRFHFIIYNAASPAIATQLNSLWSMFPPGDSIWLRPDWAKSLAAEHDGIIDAIANSDPVKARESASKHIMHACGLRLGWTPPL